MKVFVEIETHAYMDMYPSKNVNCLEEDKIDLVINNIRNNWSGGTVNSYHIMTELEAAEYVDKMIAEEKAHWQYDSQEVINNMIRLLEESYK